MYVCVSPMDEPKKYDLNTDLVSQGFEMDVIVSEIYEQEIDLAYLFLGPEKEKL